MSDNKDKWPSEGLIGAVAQGWCAEANGGKVMDSDLAFDIATSVHRYLQSRAAQPVVLSDEQIIAAFEPHIDSDPVAHHNIPTYWIRQDELIAYTRAILAAKEQA